MGTLSWTGSSRPPLYVTIATVDNNHCTCVQSAYVRVTVCVTVCVCCYVHVFTIYDVCLYLHALAVCQDIAILVYYKQR